MIVEVEYGPGDSKHYCFTAPRTRVGKTLFDPVMRRRVKVVQVGSTWPQRRRRTPRSLERCWGRRSQAPALWGSASRVQIGSDPDRRRWRYLRARLQPRDLRGRWVSRENWRAYQRYERDFRRELAYEERQQRLQWQRSSHYHANHHQWVSNVENHQRNWWADHRRIYESNYGPLNEQIASTYSIPPNITAGDNIWTADFYQGTTHLGAGTVTATTTANIIYPNRLDQQFEPEPLRDSAVISAALLTTDPNAIEHALPALQQRVECDWQERYGPLPNEPIWTTWVTRNNPHQNVEVGVMLAHDVTRSVHMIWEQWNHRGIETAVAHGRPRVPTPAERDHAEALRIEHERRTEEHRQRVERAAQEMREAEERAEELLKAHLTEEQMQDWERANRFEVVVGERRYRVTRGRAGNVLLLDQRGNPIETYCIHAHDDMPDADHCLSQKLLLESDEETFKRVANISGVRRRAAGILQ